MQSENYRPILTTYIWEHVALWTERWTQDQKVWSSIPTAGNVSECFHFKVNWLMCKSA